VRLALSAPASVTVELETASDRLEGLARRKPGATIAGIASLCPVNTARCGQP